MGLDMMLEDESLKFNIGYGAFSRLREEIAYWDEDWLDGFLNHSDCDGIITFKEAEIYYKAMEKIKIKHDRFKELKHILKTSYKNKKDIYFY